jgi:hypothetical protein
VGCFRLYPIIFFKPQYTQLKFIRRFYARYNQHNPTIFLNHSSLKKIQNIPKNLVKYFFYFFLLFSTPFRKSLNSYDILKRKLLAYIEKRPHGAVYTGSWLGFDRTTKLEAAELLFKVKFLNEHPFMLLNDQRLIGALTQGKLGDLAASSVTNLIEQHCSSSLSPY